jgi:hypothetical protein
MPTTLDRPACVGVVGLTFFTRPGSGATRHLMNRRAGVSGLDVDIATMAGRERGRSPPGSTGMQTEEGAGHEVRNRGEAPERKDDAT